MELILWTLEFGDGTWHCDSWTLNLHVGSESKESAIRAAKALSTDYRRVGFVEGFTNHITFY